MKVITHNAFVIIGAIIALIVATILGIYGQDLSYYFNERFPTIELTKAITIVTFLSIGLYIITPISLFFFTKLEKKYLMMSVFVCVLIGFPISSWSFFVWAMWMG